MIKRERERRRTYESRPGDRVGDSCGAPQQLPVDTVMVVVIIRVIVVIDGDEAGMPWIRPLGPAQTLLHQEEREHRVPVRR